MSESRWTKARREAANGRKTVLRETLGAAIRDFNAAAVLLNRMHATCWLDECEICTLIGRSGHEFSEPKP